MLRRIVNVLTTTFIHIIFMLFCIVLMIHTKDQERLLIQHGVMQYRRCVAKVYTMCRKYVYIYLGIERVQGGACINCNWTRRHT